MIEVITDKGVSIIIVDANVFTTVHLLLHERVVIVSLDLLLTTKKAECTHALLYCLVPAASPCMDTQTLCGIPAPRFVTLPNTLH